MLPVLTSQDVVFIAAVIILAGALCVLGVWCLRRGGG